MAHWLIDTSNNKKGLFYTKHQDIANNGKLIEGDDGNVIPVLGQEKMFQFHSAVDPRNIKLTSDEVDGKTNYFIGLTNSSGASFKVPFELDTIQTYLDSDSAKTSPIVFVSYVFDNADESVETKFAIENHKYLAKISKDKPDVIDIKTGNPVWSSPDSKHIVNYMFAGKLSGIPDTYYICLNSFRTEVYKDLASNENHTIEILDNSVGAIKNMILKPIVSNGTIVDNDILIAPKQQFSLNLFSNKGYIGQRSLTASNVEINVKTNLTYTKHDDGILEFDFGDKHTGYVSLHITSNSLLDQDPDLALRRTFTVHRG
jgi:hypothetical protein|tara:strand:- start:1056 stop:2000 length:945 start_codon:yes stop_codon:yes gene_type:complete